MKGRGRVRGLRRLAALPCRVRGGLVTTVLVAGILSAGHLHSQDPAGGRLEMTDTVDWHVVVTGETLRKITERYLGTEDLWYENWRLNPQIEDPDLLFPGQRIRVIKERQVPARRASLERVANDVDKNPQRSGWTAASAGDELEAPAGVRTAASSSAELALDDGSALTLTEYTQIFLREMATSVTGVRRGSIEIERGRADLDLRADRPERTDVEIILGGTVARPRVGPSGRAATRAAASEDGAKVMSYGGSTDVAAGGVTVAVPAGTGTSVPDGGTPSPPERLLARPSVVAPDRGARFGYRNPRLAWQPVPGAAGYDVEVCADAGCATLISRATALDTTSWTALRVLEDGRSDGLPAGTLYWRVTAISESGLDGYPSRPRRFEIAPPVDTDAVGERVDSSPPAVVIAVIGPGMATADVLELGDGGRLRLIAHDDASGVAEIRYRFADGRWNRWRGRDLAAPDGDGPHALEVVAEDRLGRVSETVAVSVQRRTTRPAPPTVRREARAARGGGIP